MQALNGESEFQRASNNVMQHISTFAASLTPRDKLMMQLGMRASHIEEALARGEIARAQTHLDALNQLVSQIPRTS